MATFPGFSAESASAFSSEYHTKQMVRFKDFFKDPITIIDWKLSDQIALILAIAVALFMFYFAVQCLLDKELPSKVKRFHGCYLTFLGILSLGLPYLWSF